MQYIIKLIAINTAIITGKIYLKYFLIQDLILRPLPVLSGCDPRYISQIHYIIFPI